MSPQHGHGKVSLAGCYYVHSGISETSSVLASGVELKNPRSERGHRSPLDTIEKGGKLFPQTTSHTDGSVWTHESLGRAGTLAMWPGNVKHWVPPHQGDQPRISIAFNIELSLKSPFDGSWAANGADKRLAEKIKALQ